jgi:hypothetical protein
MYVRAATLSDRQCIDQEWPRSLGFPKDSCLTGSGTQALCVYVRLQADTTCSACLFRLEG